VRQVDRHRDQVEHRLELDRAGLELAGEPLDLVPGPDLVGDVDRDPAHQPYAPARVPERELVRQVVPTLPLVGHGLEEAGARPALEDLELVRADPVDLLGREEVGVQPPGPLLDRPAERPLELGVDPQVPPVAVLEVRRDRAVAHELAELLLALLRSVISRAAAPTPTAPSRAPRIG
jgi:hypothetical protein